MLSNPTTELTIVQLLGENKRRMVAAHRAGLQEVMRTLSQEKEKLKKRLRKARRKSVCVCGLPKSFSAATCQRCWASRMAARNRKKVLSGSATCSYG